MAASRMAPVTAVTDVYAELLDVLDIGADRHRAVAELTALVAEPWADHRDDPELGSTLTDSGAPFELSVKLGKQGRIALRYVVDTADHRSGLVGNRDRYLRHARDTTGAPEATLRELLDCHLDTRRKRATPADVPARVMHGVEHAPGRRRASLYFPTSWWTPTDLYDEVTGLGVPAPACDGRELIPGASEQVEVVGYDFVDGRVTAAKTYRWLAVADGDDVAERAIACPDLEAAASLYCTFAQGVPAAAGERAGFLQLTGPDALPKLFFFPGPWGWSTPEGLGDLLGFLAGHLEVDLRPLLALRAAAGTHDLPLTLGLLAVGGPAHDPAVTCYFWPA